MGNSIDIHMAWINQDDKYSTEYLISPKLLIETMEKANCVLVETDLFLNYYHINKPWFSDVIQHEENPKNKKFYYNVGQFFGDLKGVDKEGFHWNNLMRYYVFKKFN